MVSGKLIDTEDMQQSQSISNELYGGLKSPFWDRMVARAPKKINILFTAPHSAETWRMKPRKDKEEEEYKQEKHYAEKLTYHLIVRLADHLGAGIVAWNDEQRKKPSKHPNENQDPSYLNLTEREKSPWWWLAKFYKDNAMPNSGKKTLHIDIHQQTTFGKNEIELGFSAMKKTNNPLTCKFRAMMTGEITRVVNKYSYSKKNVLVMNETNDQSRFGGNGTPVPKSWGDKEFRDKRLKACMARQTQDLHYDMSVQFELTNPLIQELIGNKPFFEDFANGIRSVYDAMQIN